MIEKCVVWLLSPARSISAASESLLSVGSWGSQVSNYFRELADSLSQSQVLSSLHAHVAAVFVPVIPLLAKRKPAFTGR